MNINNDFNRLLDIVSSWYPVEKADITNHLRRTHDVTTARNIAAACWANANSLTDTARRFGWKTAASTMRARERAEVLAEMPTHAYRIEQIVNQLQDEIPWLCLGMERGENE